MNIIGLGQCGCNIAQYFEQYSQYNIFYINTEKVESKEYLFPEQEYYVNEEKVNIGKTLLLPEQKSHEEYENNCPSLSKFLKKIKGDVLFFLGGSGAISGVTLQILEQINNCDIVVGYIRPDVELLSEGKAVQDRVVYNILQEYARSGAIKEILLFSNFQLEDIIPNVTILNRFERINEIITSSAHMINVFNNTKPILSTGTEFSQIARISTIGSYDLEGDIENLYFPLDNVREKCYYYAIPKKQLEKDTELLKTITEKSKEKSENGNIKVSYSIHSSEYDHAYCYVLAKSSQIQK